MPQSTFKLKENQTFQPQERAQPSSKAQGTHPTTEVTCFNCGQKGHYTSDPKCPRYGKGTQEGKDRPQFRAARAESDADDSAPEQDNLQEETDHREDSPYDGSQYDPDDERESADEPEQQPSGEDTVFNRAVRTTESDNETEGYRVYIRAARATALKNVREENPSRSTLRYKDGRPQRSKREEACMAGWITINGTDAFTLFDSGSTADSISPDFARVMDLRTFKLDKQIPLQLGCVGSRGSINYGVKPTIRVHDEPPREYYFDIVNIDRYDCIAGVPFMRTFELTLDFKNNSILAKGKPMKVLLPEEEAGILKGRRRGGPGRDNP
jgi:hypothetical protein